MQIITFSRRLSRNKELHDHADWHSAESINKKCGKTPRWLTLRGVGLHAVYNTAEPCVWLYRKLFRQNSMRYYFPDPRTALKSQPSSPVAAKKKQVRARAVVQVYRLAVVHIQICAHVYVHYTGGIKMVFSRRIYIFSFWFLTDDHAQYTFCCSVFISVKVWQCRRCYYSVYECLSRSLFTLGLVLIPSAGTQVWAVGRIFFLFISISLSSNSVLKRCRCHRRSTWGPISAYDWLRPLCH